MLKITQISEIPAKLDQFMISNVVSTGSIEMRAQQSWSGVWLSEKV